MPCSGLWKHAQCYFDPNFSTPLQSDLPLLQLLIFEGLGEDEEFSRSGIGRTLCVCAFVMSRGTDRHLVLPSSEKDKFIFLCVLNCVHWLMCIVRFLVLVYQSKTQHVVALCLDRNPLMKVYVHQHQYSRKIVVFVSRFDIHVESVWV